MPRETPSPIDLPDPIVDDPGGFAWGTTVIAITALVLLAVNGVSLKDWIDDLPPSPLQARAAVVADGWLTLTRAVGVAVPRDALHAQWKAAEGARFRPDDADGAAAP